MNPNALQAGLVSVTFRALSPGKIIGLAQEAHLAAIEWGGDVHVPHGDLDRAREVGRQTVDSGLQAAAYGSYYRAGVSEAETLPFVSVLETAQALGAPIIRVWAGNKGSHETSPDERKRIIDDLHRITAMASAAGLSISTEYHQNTLTDTIASAGELLDAVPDPHLQTLWQPPHEDSLEHCVKSLRAILPRLSNVHVFHWQIQRRQRLPLSEGKDRWQAYLDVLRQSAARRYLLLEFVRDDSAEQFLKDAATLREWIG
jgi:sugar phosphate isomerase/epimerase